MAKVKLSELDRTPALQVRAGGLDLPTVARYQGSYERGEILPLPVVFTDGTTHWLGAGAHRCAALDGLGRGVVDAEVREGTRADALLHSSADNDRHGLPCTERDMDARILAVLEARPEMTDRAIAKHLHVSPTTVGSHIAKLVEAGKVSRLDTRTGQDGKQHPARKKPYQPLLGGTEGAALAGKPLKAREDAHGPGGQEAAGAAAGSAGGRVEPEHGNGRRGHPVPHARRGDVADADPGRPGPAAHQGGVAATGGGPAEPPPGLSVETEASRLRETVEAMAHDPAAADLEAELRTALSERNDALTDAATARRERDEARKEVERLKTQVADLQEALRQSEAARVHAEEVCEGLQRKDLGEVDMVVLGMAATELGESHRTRRAYTRPENAAFVRDLAKLAGVETLNLNTDETERLRQIYMQARRG